MCGIAGFYDFRRDINLHDIADKMLEAIAHRGYDNRGIEEYKLNDGSSVCFGHNRLSIIGLSKLSHQPLSYNNLHISYNGEVYNYKELKSELLHLGYDFKSGSDTEVILKIFDHYGVEGISKLNGMFALAIFDSNKDKLYLVRDRLGVKPLFYYQNGRKIIFGSEVQAVLEYPGLPKEYNLEIIGNYFTNGYVSSFDSIYSKIKKIENGSILTVDLKSGESETSKYWNLDNNHNEYINDYSEAYEAFDALLDSSINYRLIADVPVGLFLSSGLDSNLILNSYLKQTNDSIETYTLKSLDFREVNVSETDSKVNRHYLTLNNEEKWGIYKTLCQKYGEPLADPATIGLYKLSSEAAKSLKVIMVGDGGDEILGGYNSYKNYLKYGDKYSFIKFLYKAISPITESILSSHIEKTSFSKSALIHSILAGDNIIDIQEKRKLLQQKFVTKLLKFNYEIKPIKTDYNSVTDFLNFKTNSELVHQLNYKTDIAGMLNTVEIREPLLDYRLFDLQQKISNDLFRKMMLEEKSKKIILDIMRNKFKIDTTKIMKMGFHLDYPAMLNNNEELEDILSCYQSNYLNKSSVNKLWESFKNERVDPSLMYRVITFIMWDYYQK